MAEAAEVNAQIENIYPITGSGYGGLFGKPSGFAQLRDLSVALREYRDAMQEAYVIEGDGYFLELIDESRLCYVGLKNSRIGEFVKNSEKRNALWEQLRSADEQDSLAKYISSAEAFVSSISVLGFSDSAVEVVPNQSAIFKLLFSQNTILIVSVALEDFLLEDPSVVFAIVENGEVIVSNYNSLENVVEGMQSYLAD